MCGICGYISKLSCGKNIINEMTDCLYHRGPNDGGEWHYNYNDYQVALGHRRLAIIDLSNNGHQPMSDRSGRFHIVFNGEIYNYLEIRDKLKSKGYDFISHSDTEVLLYAYIEYGEKCVEILNGMFSFAIYDSVENSLFAVRDRFGKKPFYYFIEGDSFVFSSELKSIMLFPFFKKELNKDVLIQYFCRNAILPPFTIFENTYKLRAGEYIIWKNGKIDKGTYYDPIGFFLNERKEIEDDYEKCKKMLRELLYDSVEKRMISDVPIGTFLSGGIDSTIVTAIARDINYHKGIDTFSIGFEQHELDESIYACQTAAYLGTRHHSKIMKESDLQDMLEGMVEYYDEPFSDASQLPTMLVSAFAKETVTVALSGDGGDELFAGYTSNDTIEKLQFFDPMLVIVRSIIPDSFSESLIKDRDRILLGKKNGLEKIQYCEKIRERMARGILPGYIGSGIVLDDRLYKIDDWKQRRMLVDLTNYIPDEIMTKTDRASMRFSLETRCPILDYRIVEYSLNIPMKYKYSMKKKKIILKDLLSDFLPENYIDRPKKGFGAPIYRWLNNELSLELEMMCKEEYIKTQGIFDYIGIKALMERFHKRNESTTTQLVWGYYVFQLWYNRYML